MTTKKPDFVFTWDPKPIGPIGWFVADAAAGYWARHVAASPGYDPHSESGGIICLDRGRRFNGHVLSTSTGRLHVNLDLEQLFRAALRGGASYAIAIHNHPAGHSPAPSEPDIRATEQLCTDARYYGIIILDSVIVSSGFQFSFARAGFDFQVPGE